MASAEISSTVRPAYIWTGSAWVPIGDGGAGGGGNASVIYSPEQPDVTGLEPGALWMDSDSIPGESGGGFIRPTFKFIETSPSSELITADSDLDTLTFIAGENISLTAASATDSITINSTGNYTSVDSVAYPDYITFDTTPEVTTASVGTLSWDSGEEGLSVQVNENVNLTLGKEIYVLAYNGEATALNPGEVVMVNGAQGQRPRVIRAYNTSDATSARTFGMVAETIASGTEGIVITQGVIGNIDTDDYNSGDILYLSASPGLVTTVKPQAPNHYVWVGVVLKKNASSGRIYVKPQNGYELDEIHDVRIVDEQDGHTIVWNSASSLWINKDLENTYLTIASASATYEPDIPYVSASPTGPVAGTLWIDSTNNAAPSLKVYNGTEWIAVSGAPSESGFHPFFGGA